MYILNPEILYDKSVNIYPGDYIPSSELDNLLHKTRIKLNTDYLGKPPVNLDEYDSDYRIEVIVPGVKREDIFVYVKNNILTIILLHKNSEELKKTLQIHEFETECLERNIELPKNADPEFLSAEYQQGILILHVPKAKETIKSISKRIVVY
jgi:HSP20 family protein